jgi:hypothetical protein
MGVSGNLTVKISEMNNIKGLAVSRFPTVVSGNLTVDCPILGLERQETISDHRTPLTGLFKYEQ